jgi:CheY-like chemotaxis protein
MISHGSRWAASVVVLATLLPGSRAQEGKDAPAKDNQPAAAPAKDAGPAPAENDYRQFFKKPQTPLEFWKAMQFELEVGRPDLAGALLHALIESKPPDEAIVELVDTVGMSAILRLRNRKPWIHATPPDLKDTEAEIAKLSKERTDPQRVSELRAEVKRATKEYTDTVARSQSAEQDVETLITSVTDATKRVRGDPKRIAGLIDLLSASPEEGVYALRELYKSGPLAVPQIIDGLRTPDAPDRAILLDALRKLSSDVVPAIVAALDSNNAQLKVDLIDVLLKRVAREVVPNLWFLSASPTEAEAVRLKASQALLALLDLQPGRLPPAKAALTAESEKYYHHRVLFPDPRGVTIWRWDNGHVVAGWPNAPTVPATVAEEYYGTRFANQALALDPTYRPAQIALLSLVLDKSAEKIGPAQPLAKGAPKVHELLATTSPELIDAVLERALNERRTAVALLCVRALGGLADPHANRPSVKGEPILVRALYYPDRRVQMAAAEAILRGADPIGSAAGARVLDVLRRALAAEPTSASAPKVLIGFANQAYAGRVADAVRAAGFEPVKVYGGREVLTRLGQAADIDILLLDSALPNPGLASLLGQLAADTYAAHLPIVLVAPESREESTRRFCSRDARITVAPEAIALLAPDLKTLLKERLAAAPDGPPLSAAELQDYAERSIRYLAALSFGNPQGIEVRPANDAILDALRAGKLSPEGQLAAIAAAGRINGVRTQNELAAVILDGRRPLPVRLSATRELVRHIQSNTILLTRLQTSAFEALLVEPSTDPALKAELALLVGSLKPDARLTGERLLRYQPPIPGAAAAPAPPSAAPKEEKEKEKE